MINQRFSPIDAIHGGETGLHAVKSKRHNPFVYIALAAALLVSMTQVGCIGLTSAGATEPTTATTVAIGGATGSFGSVATGTSATQTFTMTNTGATTLTVTKLSVTGTGYSVSGFTLPITVAAGKSSTFAAKFAPSTSGTVAGSISIAANTNPAVSVIALTGAGTSAGQPVPSVSPSSVNFGTAVIGVTVGQTITVTNAGAGTLTISNVAVAGPGFSISSVPSLPIDVAAGQNFSFKASMVPPSAGALSGGITIANNSPTPSVVIALNGAGAPAGQPGISVSPVSINFGTAAVGVTLSQSLTLTNSGNATLSVSNIIASGAGFSVSGVTLPIQIAPLQSTTFSASMIPQTTGTLSGSIIITNNTATPSVVVALSGTGGSSSKPSITVFPSNVAFGTVPVGTTMSQLLTITNPSASTLTISSVTAAGLGFSVTGVALPMIIPAGQNKTFSASIVPPSQGTLSGSITIANDSTTPNVVVGLSGTGASTSQPGISVSPASIAFGNVTIGAPNSQTIVLQNNGTAALTISQASVSGAGFSMSGLAIPATIAAGSSTTFNVAFGPAAAGTISGSVSLVSNAPGSPTAIPLSGTGVAVTKLLGSSTTGVAFGNVAVGSNSSQNVTLTNSGNSTVTISSVNVTGTGYSSSGVTAGQTIGAGQTATLGVTFTPTAAATTSGNVTVTSNATNSPISVSLSGTGTQVVAHSVSLTWTASTSAVAGYNVYRSTTSGGPYTLITSSPVAGTTYTDTNVQAGVTYYYVVTAVDASGNESVNSNEASITIPTP